MSAEASVRAEDISGSATAVPKMLVKYVCSIFLLYIKERRYNIPEFELSLRTSTTVPGDTVVVVVVSPPSGGNGAALLPTVRVAVLRVSTLDRVGFLLAFAVESI